MVLCLSPLRILGSLAVLAGLWAPDVHAASVPTKRATVCNGRSELCGRRYGNTTFLTAHNSFAFSSNPLALSRNQAVDIPTQLSLGARTLQGQAHLENGQLRFCHSSCILFDGGLVVDYLRTVKKFLDANPNEVFTFIFTNPDGASIPNVWKPVFDQAGITPLAYVPPVRPMKRDEWPTLGELIDSGKRIIIFLDSGADGSAGGQVDFILPQFPMMWEDRFSPTDASFPCIIHRTAGPLHNDDHLHLINHNLNRKVIGDIIVPAFTQASNTNGQTSILAHANGCAPLSKGRAPNFVLLDFIDIGEGKRAVDRLNGF